MHRSPMRHGNLKHGDTMSAAEVKRLGIGDVRLITIGGGTSEIMKEILSKRMGWG